MSNVSARVSVGALVRLPLFLVMGVCLAASCQAQFIWNFDVPTGAVTSPHTYLDTTNTYPIPAYGYTTQFASPTTANLGDTWTTGTVTPNDLYGKLSSPDETGLGLDGITADHEINEQSFVQLDLMGLFANGLVNLTMTVSSVQEGEGYYLWGSNTLGVPGVLLRQYVNTGGGDVDTFVVPQYGMYRYISVSATPPTDDISDVLIRDGLSADPPSDPRRCFVPVTFTQEGWAAFCAPQNPIINGGMIYGRFQKAFSCFTFFGVPSPNKLIVGGRYTITYTGTTASLQRLCTLLSLPCAGCSKLQHSLVSPWILNPSDGGGCLAVQTIVLLMNVAYNDMRQMPKTPGYDLECFVVTKGLYKGKTVAEVFNIANAILAGDPPCKYGLRTCDDLVAILQAINENYEFVNFGTTIDRGFLLPNRPFGKPDPAHCPSVPMVCP